MFKMMKILKKFVKFSFESSQKSNSRSVFSLKKKKVIQL